MNEINTNPIDNFFQANTPQAIGLISILGLILAVFQIKHWIERSHEDPFVVQKGLSWFRQFVGKFHNCLRALQEKLLKITPPIIKNTLSPENKRLNDFVLINHKSISIAYAALILLIAVMARRHVFHNKSLSLLFFIFLLFTYHLFNKLLIFLTANQIFQVCPFCGYTNKTISDRCRACDNKDPSGINVTNNNGEPAILLDEVSEYKNAGAHGDIPLSILKGLRLSSDEVVLIYSKVQTIKKNGIRRIYDTNGLPCLLNTLCITNKRFYFIASLFGGWRAIYSYNFDSIAEYDTSTRTSVNILKPLGETYQYGVIESLTIKTNDGNAYSLKGLNRHKLFHAVVSCLRKRKVVKSWVCP